MFSLYHQEHKTKAKENKNEYATGVGQGQKCSDLTFCFGKFASSKSDLTNRPRFLTTDIPTVGRTYLPA